MKIKKESSKLLQCIYKFAIYLSLSPWIVVPCNINFREKAVTYRYERKQSKHSAGI